MNVMVVVPAFPRPGRRRRCDLRRCHRGNGQQAENSEVVRGVGCRGGDESPAVPGTWIEARHAGLVCRDVGFAEVGLPFAVAGGVAAAFWKNWMAKLLDGVLFSVPAIVTVLLLN
jgi:hypothetical protein